MHILALHRDCGFINKTSDYHVVLCTDMCACKNVKVRMDGMCVVYSFCRKSSITKLWSSSTCIYKYTKRIYYRDISMITIRSLCLDCKCTLFLWFSSFRIAVWVVAKFFKDSKVYNWDLSELCYSDNYGLYSVLYLDYMFYFFRWVISMFIIEYYMYQHKNNMYCISPN